MRIDDNGTVRIMTAEEEAAYLAEMEVNAIEEEAAPVDYEAALAKLGVD